MFEKIKDKVVENIKRIRKFGDLGKPPIQIFTTNIFIGLILI